MIVELHDGTFNNNKASAWFFTSPFSSFLLLDTHFRQKILLKKMSQMNVTYLLKSFLDVPALARGSAKMYSAHGPRTLSIVTNPQLRGTKASSTIPLC